MRSVRRRVRSWVTTWLICQVAAVSAFAPRECCEAHRPAVATASARAVGHHQHHQMAPAGHHAEHHGNPGREPSAAAGRAHHHSTSTAGVVGTAAATQDSPRAGSCPMRGPNGEPCPMHADQAAVPAADTGSARAGDRSAADGRECVMRGACHGPITAVVTLFLTPADPLHVYTLAADQAQAFHIRPAADPTLALSPSVLTPPPRA